MIDKCNACFGKGEIIENGKKKTCEICKGVGKLVYCELCNAPISPPPQVIPVCAKCENEKKVVYQLDSVSTIEDLVVGKRYLGTVREIQSFGYFISLNENIRGLLHIKNTKRRLKLNEEVVVLVSNVIGNRIELKHVEIDEYTLFPFKKFINRSKISEIDESTIGKLVKVQGMVVQVRITSGPTIFTIIDETSSIEAIAYRKGMRAFPNINVDDIVTIVGEVSTRLGSIRIEIKEIEKLYGKEFLKVKGRLDRAIEEKAKPDKIEFLIQNDILEKLRVKLELAAKEIKKAIYTGVPIIIRHHADADGFVGGIALEQAILPILKEWSPDLEAEWHLFRRSPSKAPFYEMEDAVRDLYFAHEDMRRFGQKMPLLVLVDNGSTREDIPSLKKFRIYNSKIIVIDHHYPGEVIKGKVEVDEFVDVHINPYLVGGDYTLTAGCLACELARMINPSITPIIEHLPAVACIADRVDLEYINLAKEKGIDEEHLKKIAEAIDFEAFYLRFMDGKTLIEDLLGLGRLDRHRKLVEHIYNEAMKMQNRQLRACLPNVRTVILKNGIVLNTIDLEKHAHKFTYPPPGKTCGLVHDVKVREYEGKPLVTLGYGTDFSILRATDEVAQMYGFNLNNIVEELQRELPEAGVDGGGHEVAGSIKFVEGYRKQVLERFAEKIARLKRNNVEKD